MRSHTHRIAYLLTAFLFSLPSSYPPCAAQTSSKQIRLAEPYHQAQFPSLFNGGVSRWENGYLISYLFNGRGEANSSSPAVEVYGKGGEFVRQAVVSFDGAKLVTMSAATMSRTQNLFVSGASVSDQGAIASFIAEIGADDRIRRVVRTNPFSPRLVCAMEDGTVWSYGFERDDHFNAAPNAPRLRHFSFDKGQLQALLDTSVLNDNWSLDLGRYPGEVSLRCNSKTIVLYNGQTGDLIEVDSATGKLKATKLTPLPPPPNFAMNGFVLTESGDLFASFKDRSHSPKAPPLSGLFRLDRGATNGASWVPLEETVGPYLHGGPIERLIGADGDDLVYSTLKDGRLYWSKQRVE
jgi:hypothetical protein